MSLPTALRAVLPPDTARHWPQVASVAPAGAVLVGGTALAFHLQHRLSRDLDVFVLEPFDTDELAASLARLGPFAITLQNAGTLNGVLGRTKVQFLQAGDQTFVEELRDYFDIKAIEERGGRTVEEGLVLFTEHYQLRNADSTIYEIVRGLGYYDDLDEDPGVPEPLADTVRYWQGRVPALAAALRRGD